MKVKDIAKKYDIDADGFEAFVKEGDKVCACQTVIANLGVS